MSLGSDQNFGRRGEVEEIVEKRNSTSTEQRRRSNTSTEEEKNEEKNKQCSTNDGVSGGDCVSDRESVVKKSPPVNLMDDNLIYRVD